MIRTVAACLSLFLLATCLRAADEPAAPPGAQPPVRLKKKSKPAATGPEKPALPKEQKDQTEPTPPKDAERRDRPAAPASGATDRVRDDAAIMQRVSKNMRAAEERLAEKDPGLQTRRLQDEILKDLDDLIKQAQQAPQQQQQQQQHQQRQAQTRQAAAPQRSGHPRPTGRGQAPKQATAGGVPPVRDSGTISKDRLGKIADLYKDVWGHLPETLRMEMDQYSREQFMPKYSDLLKQYYTTIAEKGRKRDDR